MDNPTFHANAERVREAIHNSVSSRHVWSSEFGAPVDEIVDRVVFFLGNDAILHTVADLDLQNGSDEPINGTLVFITDTMLIGARFASAPADAPIVEAEEVPRSAIVRVEATKVRDFVDSPRYEHWPTSFVATLVLDRPIVGEETVKIAAHEFAPREHIERLVDLIRQLVIEA